MLLSVPLFFWDVDNIVPQLRPNWSLRTQTTQPPDQNAGCLCIEQIIIHIYVKHNPLQRTYLPTKIIQDSSFRLDRYPPLVHLQRAACLHFSSCLLQSCSVSDLLMTTCCCWQLRVHCQHQHQTAVDLLISYERWQLNLEDIK